MSSEEASGEYEWLPQKDSANLRRRQYGGYIKKHILRPFSCEHGEAR